MKNLHAVRQDVQALPIVVPRADLDLIESWVPMGARVLDLGCGDGSFLARLMKTRNAKGYGVEIDDTNVQRSVANGINVIQQDLEKGLAMFEDHAFDVVVLSQTIRIASVVVIIPIALYVVDGWPGNAGRTLGAAGASSAGTSQRLSSGESPSMRTGPTGAALTAVPRSSSRAGSRRRRPSCGRW